MKTAINASTYIASADNAEKGTVELTLGLTTKRVYASKSEKYGWIIASGTHGRYQTGAKAWPASITLNLEKGTESVWFGRDDRCGKFKKIIGQLSFTL